MKTRKLLALIMTIALALSLFACGASEAGKDTPPFSKVSLDCSEDDVVKAYGECSNISTNDQGGNVYTYLSDYKGKDGALDQTESRLAFSGFLYPKPTMNIPNFATHSLLT